MFWNWKEKNIVQVEFLGIDKCMLYFLWTYFLSRNIPSWNIYHWKYEWIWAYDRSYDHLLIQYQKYPYSTSNNHYICFTKLAWRNCGDWIVRRRGIRWSIGIRVRPMKFCGLEPFNTFIACELQGYTCSHIQKSSNIHVDLPVDCLACKIELLIGLDKEIGHH